MKKLFTFLMISLLVITTWSCSYDDDDLWNAVEGLGSRVEEMEMEKAMRTANSDIDALETLVDALQNNVTITSVVSNENGYVITFSNDETATITNGQDGINAPAISVKQNEDGFYYWTLDGEYLLVDGEKIKAQGTDGTNGISPKLRINSETKMWEMSTDGGQIWTSMDIVAEGKEGNSMFVSVDTDTKQGFAIFTLTAGGKIEIPMQGALSIAISSQIGIFTYDDTQTFTIESKGVEKLTYTKPDGWKVSVKDNKLTVVAPAIANSYAETEGIISLIGMAGNSSCMAELKVSIAEHNNTVTFEGSDWSPWVVSNYAPGSYSTMAVGSPDDYVWVDATTQLTTGRPLGFINGWGYPWFVCSYNSSSLDQSSYGSYMYDLYVYNPNATENSTTGGGNNSSDNFLTTYGYLDLDFPYGDGRPILTFADEKPRTIKSIYVNSTCYFYSVATSGNGLSPALSKDVTYYATGYDADDNEIKTITMTFASTDFVTKTWTEWDLSELGPIVSLRINQAGGADNGYGYSLPAYLAIDDITVIW